MAEVFNADEARELTIDTIIPIINAEIKTVCKKGQSSLVFRFYEDLSDNIIDEIKSRYRKKGYSIADDFNPDDPNEILIDW